MSRNVAYNALAAETWKAEQPGDEIQGIIWTIGMKYIKTDPVPYVQIQTEDTGDIVEILLSNFALEKLYYSQQLKEGRFLSLRYRGESKTIKNAGNYMKLWDYYLEDEEGKPIVIKDEMTTGEVADSDYDLDAPLKAPQEEKAENGKSKSKSKSGK